jgi:tRNA 2-thiouridine synthesizing protein E
MTATMIADTSVDVDAEGFLTNPQQWNEQLAEQLARENGIPELTERHWLVVRFMRERYLTTGTAPSIRALGKESGVPIRSSTSSSPRARPSSPPRSAASPSPRLHLERAQTMTDHTRTLEQPQLDATEPKTLERSPSSSPKGSLEGIYPGLIMANGARMDGIEADLFFTFFGLDANPQGPHGEDQGRRPSATRPAPAHLARAPCPASPRSRRR